jgi:hypothetical protein
MAYGVGEAGSAETSHERDRPEPKCARPTQEWPDQTNKFPLNTIAGEPDSTIQFIIFIVDDSEARNILMLLKPRTNLISTRPFRHVWCDADKRNSTPLGAKYASRIVTPGRGQNNLRAGAVQKTSKSRQKSSIDYVGKTAGICGLVAVQDTINVQKNHFHRDPASLRGTLCLHIGSIADRATRHLLYFDNE